MQHCLLYFLFLSNLFFIKKFFKLIINCILTFFYIIGFELIIIVIISIDRNIKKGDSLNLINKNIKNKKT